MNRDNRYFITHFSGLMAGVFLVIFSVYYINVTLFTHYHVVDGVTIAHSHFHSEGHTDPDSQAHSKSELTLIQILSNFVVEFQSVITFVSAVVLSLVLRFGVYSYNQISLGLAAHPQLRAPPAESILG